MYPAILRLSRLMAALGGVVLCLIIVITCVSILGRWTNGLLHSETLQSMMPGLADFLLALGIGPVNGDYELVEAGMAFVIFSFLPLCQIQGAHASVDVFTAMMPRSVNRLLHWLADMLFAGVLALICVQFYGGMLSKQSSGQTTLLLEFPVWWAYAFSMAGAVLAAVVGIYLAGARTAELVTGQDILPSDLGAEH